MTTESKSTAMDPPQFPLDIAEILDYCIDFLHDSILDLRACALVSRIWVSPAQSHIFREISIGAKHRDPAANKHLWERLQDILESSPHLVAHIHQLDLRPRFLSREILTAACNFPFTQLRSVSILPFRLDYRDPGAFEQLLSHPTLRRARIMCSFDDPASLPQVFARCPPGLRHIELQCGPTVSYTLSSTLRPPSSLVPLQSLRLTAPPAGHRLGDWLTHDYLPFDFSGLKVLSLTTDTKIVHWPNFVPVFRTLEIFDFVADGTHPPIDLSSFRSLRLVRACAHTATEWERTIDALSTLTPAQRIRTIVLRGSLHVAPQQLDTVLAHLPMAQSPTVELEITTQQYDFVAPNFPELTAKRLLRRADFDVHWFENSIDR
ncbi:hypothetical protein FB451DRAFT_1529829 [Mycena latifolia]|nr:hypothetical protein FB451DRAFT_1529829 [Mycena latifolia]